LGIRVLRHPILVRLFLNITTGTCVGLHYGIIIPFSAFWLRSSVVSVL